MFQFAIHTNRIQCCECTTLFDRSEDQHIITTPDRIACKLEIKPEREFYDWLDHYIIVTVF